MIASRVLTCPDATVLLIHAPIYVEYGFIGEHQGRQEPGFLGNTMQNPFCKLNVPIFVFWFQCLKHLKKNDMEKLPTIKRMKCVKGTHLDLVSFQTSMNRRSRRIQLHLARRMVSREGLRSNAAMMDSFFSVVPDVRRRPDPVFRCITLPFLNIFCASERCCYVAGLLHSDQSEHGTVVTPLLDSCFLQTKPPSKHVFQWTYSLL